MKSSPFFKPEEFACKCNYDSCVDALNFMSEQLLDAIFKIRAQVDFPMIVNSAYRCSKHNKDVGGSRYSYHCKGMAVDIRMTNPHDRYELVEQAINHGLTVIIYPTFVHLDCRKGQPLLALGK